MDSGTSFGVTSILNVRQFSWVFVVEWGVIVCLALFILFYANQLMGSLLSHAVSWVLWRQYKVTLRIGSIQFSLLSARIFFKNVRYIGSNEGISIAHGYITWRYWLRNPLKPTILDSSHSADLAESGDTEIDSIGSSTSAGSGAESGESAGESGAESTLHSEQRKSVASPSSQPTAKEAGEKRKKRRCAICLNIDGLEWFVYNRSPSYDGINQLVNNLQVTVQEAASDLTFFEQKLLKVLPFQVIVKNAALVMGNERTESLLTVTAKQLVEVVDIKPSGNAFDRYRMSFHSTMHQLGIRMRANIDYVDPMGGRAVPLSRVPRKSPPWYTPWKTSAEPELEPWSGLPRYKEGEDDPSEHLNRGEYARVSSVAEAERVEVDYFYDVAGPEASQGAEAPGAKASQGSYGHGPSDDAKESHSSEHRDGASNSAEGASRGEPDIEGTGSGAGADVPPDFGINATISAAFFNYGPWAERQRQQLMDVFFPRTCVDATPPGMPDPGTLRATPKMNVNVVFDSTFSVRVPTREASKNDAARQATETARKEGLPAGRPYGWLEVRALAGSKVTFATDLMATKTGWTTQTRLELVKPELRSSVNHAVAFRADSHVLTCRQKSPLQWNGLQNSSIDQVSEGLQIYILREHVMLISDLVGDFGAGPPATYSLFTPAKYFVNWRAHNFELLFNVNAANIINNPTSATENTFIVFKAADVNMDMMIPIVQVRPVENNVHMELTTSCLNLELRAPPWHTLESFLESPSVGRVYDFKLALDYHYRIENDHRKPDMQIIGLTGRDLTLLTHGFVIDYLMVIRENYFGDHFHFMTTEEYLAGNRARESPESAYTRSESDSDVHIHADVERACLVLPGYLYSAKDCLTLDFARFGADCRFTNYYMDMQVEFSPVTGHIYESICTDNILDFALEGQGTQGVQGAQGAHGARKVPKGEPLLFLDEIILRAHRMFGLPPSEPTYVCKWDIDLGNLSVDGPMAALDLLKRIGACFGHSFAGRENKPQSAPEELFDVTFVSIGIASLKALLRADDARIELLTTPIALKINDYATDRYSGKTTVMISKVEIEGFAPAPAFSLSFPVAVTNFVNKRDARRHRQLQQDHIMHHDTLFHRCPFLLDDEHRNSTVYNAPPAGHVEATLALPALPPQLTRQTVMSRNPLTGDFDLGRRSASPSSASSRSQYSNSLLYSLDSTDDDDEGTARHAHQFGAFEPFAPEPADAGPAEDAREHGDYLPPPHWDRRAVPKEVYDFGLGAHEWFAGAPALSAPENMEVDNLVVQFGAVTAAVTPAIIDLADATRVSLQTVSIEAMIDGLEVDVVKELTAQVLEAAVRAHVVVPSVSVKFGHAHRASSTGDTPEERELSPLEPEPTVLPSLAPDAAGLHVGPDYVFLRVEKANTMVQVGSEPLAGDVSVGLFTVGVHRGRPHGVSAMLGQISDFRGWLSEADETLVSVLHPGNADVYVSASNAAWLVRYGTELAGDVQARVRTMRAAARPDTLAAAVAWLAEAGDKHAIEQDSYVLSRPSGAVQSETHVRSHLSWRVAVRLRHVLRQLPAGEVAAAERAIADASYRVPRDARDRTMAVFRRWRSWEQSEDLNRAIIFARVFDAAKKTPVSAVAADGLINGIALRIGYSDLSEDYLVLDLFKLTGVFKSPKEGHHIGATASCGKVRSSLSKRLMHVLTELVEQHAAQHHSSLDAPLDPVDAPSAPSALHSDPAAGTDPGTDSDSFHSADSFHTASNAPTSAEGGPGVRGTPLQNAPASSASSASSTGSRGSTVKGTLALFIQDMSLQACFDALGLETQHNQLQASVTFQKSGAHLQTSSVLASATSGLRLFVPDSDSPDLLDYIMQGLTLGHVKSSHSASRVSLGVDTLSLASRVTVLELSKTIMASVQHDLPVLRALLAAADKVPKVPKVPKAPAAPQPLAPHLGMHVNMRVAAIKVHVPVLDTLRMSLTGEGFVLRLREPERQVTLSDFRLGRGVFSVTYNKNTTVVSVGIDAPSAVLRHEQAPRLVEGSVGVRGARLDTMELLLFLEVVRELGVLDELERVSAVFAPLSSAAQPAGGIPPQSETPAVAPLLVRLHGKIGEARATLPLDAAAVALVCRALSFRYENFVRGADDLPVPQPLQAACWLDELRVELSQQAPVLSLQMTFTYNADADDARIQLSSEFCRVTLSPAAVGELAQAVHRLQNQVPLAAESADAGATGGVTGGGDGVRVIERLSTVLVLHNASFTWQTGPDAHDGFVLGYEQLRIQQTGLTARMELTGVTLAPLGDAHSAKGNLARLPRMALTCVFLKQAVSFLYVQTEGDSLGVDITPSIAPLVAANLDSFNLTRRLLESARSAAVLPSGDPSQVASQSASRSSSRSRRSRAASRASSSVASSRTSSPIKPPASSAPASAEGGPGVRGNPPRDGPAAAGPAKGGALKLPISLHVESAFATTVVRLFDEYAETRTASMQLQTPAAKLVGNYVHTTSGKDSLDVVLKIAESSNTVHPRALQELRKISRQVKGLMNRSVPQRRPRRLSIAPGVGVGLGRRPSFRQLASPTSPSGPGGPSGPTSPASPDARFEPLSPRDPRDALTLDTRLDRPRARTRGRSNTITWAEAEARAAAAPAGGAGGASGGDMDKVLSDIEFTIRVDLAAQDFTLSCEPFAKVSTVMSLDRIVLLVTTPVDEQSRPYVALSAKVRKVRLSLQHVYSRETSAFAGISEIAVTGIHRRHGNAPIQVGICTAGPEFGVRLDQLHDMEAFIDVWTSMGVDETPGPRSPRSRASSRASRSQPTSPVADTPLEGLAGRYRNAMQTVALPWALNVSVTAAKGTVDFGRSIGEAQFSFDRLWLAVFKTSARTQHYALGLDHLLMTCEGRVGGAVDLSRLRARLTIEWQKQHELPLITAALGIKTLVTYLSFDFHPFLAGSIRRLTLNLSNQRGSQAGSEATAELDHLRLNCDCDAISGVFIALVASHLFDIRNLFNRLKPAPISLSERPLEPADADHAFALARKKLISGLHVKANLHFGTVALYAFPTEFTDPVSVHVSWQELSAQFSQYRASAGLHAKLNLASTALSVGLATGANGGYPSDGITELKTQRFLDYMSKCTTPSNIVTIPQCEIHMFTLTEPDGLRVDYRFRSSFGGAVEVGWNLGSVNFIRELGKAHERAWQARKEMFLAGATSIKVDGAAETDSRFSAMPEYVPLVPPEIKIPQLHDMGEATPPVEWIGLNREKLPGAVHWYVIRALNGVAKDVEYVYDDILGHL